LYSSVPDDQSDFKEEKTVVQKYIESKGHIFIMSPRYHCELQFIEQYWEAVKLYLRGNCDSSIKGLRETIKTAMMVPSLASIRDEILCSSTPD
jgi:hypothetical protein